MMPGSLIKKKPTMEGMKLLFGEPFAKTEVECFKN